MEKGTLVNCSKAVNEYINREDWRISANANTGYSSAGLVNNLAGKMIANWWLDEVYSKEEGEAHRNGDYHIHDLDILGAYCCGHDLQKLLQEGFNGVISRVGAKPPKHFREALYQMANYLGILQAEWAGAQAFSSFDTLLAPYVFYDMYIHGVSEADIKKAIVNFIYNLNVPSRWGQCVPSSYRCLRGDGTWVNYEGLQIGDEIYVVDMETGLLKKDKITHLNQFDAPKKMHRYSNKSNGFKFDVTPNHRVIYKTGSNNMMIKESAELLDYDMVGIPIAPWGKHTPESFMSNEYDIQDELLELIAYIMTDGTITKQEGKQTRISWFKSPRRFGIERFEELCDILGITYSRRKDESSKFEGSFVYEYRLNVSEVTNKIVELLDGTKHKTPEFIQYLSPRQCYIMIDAWVLMDGHFDGAHWKMQADNKEIQEMLAYLSIKAGKAVSLNERLIGTNKNATIYTQVHKRQVRSCIVNEVEVGCEKVWCPTTETGTFVCMTDEGYVFLTGNSPFSNLTIDWTVPTSLKDLVPMRGDKPYFVGIYEHGLKEKVNSHKETCIGESKYLKFIDEIRRRLNDYESDEEMLMYSISYKIFQPEMDIINRCFYQVLNEGDKDGQPFTFPIPTVNITEDFDWDNPNCYYLFENAAKYGSSYFQNFIGSQYLRDENGKLTIKDPNAYSPNDLRSMCPLTLDTQIVTQLGPAALSELDEKIHKVRTNMARWANFKKSPIYDNHQVLRITFENKTFVDMSTEHLQYATKYENGEITGKLYKASELEVGMKCLFMYDYRVDDSRISHVSGSDEWAITQIEKLGVMPTQCIEIITDDEDEHEFRLANGLMTHNCRLQLDKRALRKRGGGLFGSDSQTGSIGVVTINMARLGYLYKGDMKSLKACLKELCDMASSTLEKKRKVVEKYNEQGLYPYTRRYINTLDTFFSTIGVNGMNEMVRNFTNDEYDITDSRGQEMCKDLLDFINEQLLRYQEETGTLYNLEATPAEGTTRRLSALDLKRYADIIQAGYPEAPYYTNSSQLPVDFSTDPFAVLDLQDELQKKYTGGTTLHLYMSERLSSPEAAKQLVKKVFENYRLPYISITPVFSICPKHGYIPGEHAFCPKCDKEIMAAHAEELDFNS